MSKKKNRTAKTVRTRDSFQNPLSRTGVFMPNLMEATEYPLTRFTRDWQTINSLYRSHWVVRRIIDCIPEDMIKAGYKIISQTAPDSIKKVVTCDRTTHTSRKILEGLKWGRLYGGAGGLIMVDGQEDMLDKPLELEMIMPGSYKGLLILDRWSGITPNDELVTDPSDPEFGLPDTYTITSDVLPLGIKVHHSRIVRFMGRPLPYLEQLAETYWGASEIEHIFDELRKRDNVSWNIAMLTFMANLRVLKLEGMGQVLAVGNQQAQEDLYNTMQAMNAMMNNNSIQILGENDSYESHQYTFGGIGETYDRFMMDLAGAAETPVTKLFGRSPAGMNATGEGDMQNYYDTIEEKQENELRPAYDKLLPIMFVSALGGVPDDLDYEFNPVRRAPEEEMADLASKNTDSVTKAFQAGLISQRTALKELRQQSELTGMWSNITDEDIEKADDEVMNPDEGMGGMGGPDGMGGEIALEGAENSDREQVYPEDEKSAQNEREEVLGAKGTKGNTALDSLIRRVTDYSPNQPRDKTGKFSSKYGTKVSVDKEEVRRYNGELRNTKTSTGVVIKTVSGHAVGRLKERGISIKTVRDILTSKESRIDTGNTARTTCFDKGKIRVVIDHEQGKIVSIMHRRGGR